MIQSHRGSAPDTEFRAAVLLPVRYRRAASPCCYYPAKAAAFAVEGTPVLNAQGSVGRLERLLTLDALGNIGDFIGGIGVVVTLLYLAGQIRQNTRSVQVSAYHAAQRDVADVLDTVSSDPELTRIFFDGNRDYESLSREDRRRYALCITSLLRKLENILHQTRLGTLDRAQWEGLFSEFRRIFAQPGTRAWWVRGRSAFNRELQNFVEQEVIVPSPDDPAA